jgi:beta-glucosidase
VAYGYYHGYTLVEKKGWTPAYPFGHGLSYTRYEYADLALEAATIPADGTLRASVSVTNAGPRAGEEIVELYVGFRSDTVDRPLKLLRGFERLALAPGETKRVSLAVKAADLAYYDPARRGWVVERTDYAVLVGPSSRADQLLSTGFQVADPPAPRAQGTSSEASVMPSNRMVVR